MKLRTLLVAALALTTTSPMAVYSISALTANDDAKAAPGAPATLVPQDQAMLAFSEAGHAAMQDIRGARLAILAGNSKDAMKLMEAARAHLGEAQKDAPIFDVPSAMVAGRKVVGTASERREMGRVPVDGEILLADNFVTTPEKQAHVDKANQHFKNGDYAKALDELRLGEIDVNYMRSWLPIVQSEKHLRQAIRLAVDGKYYEANLALEAMEDTATTDSMSFRDLPKDSAK